MPIINGIKYACEPCMRGHRSSKCNHQDRILIKVRKPGRPLSSCPHEAGSCSCEVASVAIPKTSANCPCGSPSGITKVKKDDKGPKFDRSRAGSHTSSIPNTPTSQQKLGGMGFSFPNGFVPNMESDLVSPMDQGHMWPPQVPGGINPMAPPLDVGASSGIGFYGTGIPSNVTSVPLVKPPVKKSCCKPENGSATPVLDNSANMFQGFPSPGMSSNGQFTDPRGRRHTTDLYSRKRPSIPGYGVPIPDNGMQFHQAYDGRSTSVPSVPPMPQGLINYGGRDVVPLSEESQNQGYTIYTAPRYNQSQVNYMNAIREAHEKQQQDEAEAARRASEAGEHAQRMNGGGCCAPADVSGMDKTLPSYVLPHGQECGCGPNCSCIMCATHPYNSATIEYIRNIHQTMQTPEDSSGEHSPSTQGFAHSVAGGTDFSANGGLGVFGEVGLDITADEKSMHALQQESNPLEMSPSAFIHVEYNLGTCAQANGSCMCGDGCTCVGCLTHGGHNGVLLGSNLLPEPAELEHQAESSLPDMNGHNASQLGADQTPQTDAGDIVWKTEDSITSPETKSTAL